MLLPRVPLLTAVRVSVAVLPTGVTGRLGVACMKARTLAAAAVALSPAAIAVATDTPPTRNGMTPGAVAVPANATAPVAATDAGASA